MIYKILLIGNVIFSVTAQILLKSGMKKIGLVELNVNFFEKFKKMALSPYLWLAMTAFGVSFILYAIVLSKIELSRSYPIAIMSGIILIFIISVIFFNESINIFKIIGLILCIVGIVFLFK